MGHDSLMTYDVGVGSVNGKSNRRRDSKREHPWRIQRAVQRSCIAVDSVPQTPSIRLLLLFSGSKVILWCRAHRSSSVLTSAVLIVTDCSGDEAAAVCELTLKEPGEGEGEDVLYDCT